MKRQIIGERPKREGVTLIELHRALGCLSALLETVAQRAAPPAHSRLRDGEEGDRPETKSRVEFDSTPQQPLGLEIGFLRVPIPKLASAQEAIIGLRIVRLLSRDVRAVAGAEIEGERRDDAARHVVLHRENVGELAVEPLGPQVPAGGRVDKLRT